MKDKRNNIFIIGHTGSGKTSIGLELSKLTNMNFYDSDKEIENYFNMNINDIFKYKGEKEFRIKEEIIIKKLSTKNNIILSTGGGSIESEKTRKILSLNGIIIFLKININILFNRLINNNYNRPLLNKKYNKNKILENMYNNRNKFYEEISNIIVDTNKKDINEIINDIIFVINNTNLIKY